MKQRLITGVIAGAGFITLLWLGGIWYTLLILLLAAVGYVEFSRMNGEPPWKLTGLLGLLGTLYVTFPWSHYPTVPALRSEAVIWLLLFLVFAVTVLTKNKVTIDRVALVFLGTVYVATGFHYMIETRLIENGGVYWSLLLFVCIWGTDSGAYFVGRKFGKTLLWPAISPKKTVEGAIGGILVSVVVAVCFSLYAPDMLFWGRAIALGVVIGIVGQMGDLIQSAYKRVRNIKDTGAILPGHGGVLDRCDSWLIVFPFIHLLGLLPH